VGGGGGLKIETWGKRESERCGSGLASCSSDAGREAFLTSLVVGEAAGRVRERQLCAKEGREREREREFSGAPQYLQEEGHATTHL